MDSEAKDEYNVLDSEFNLDLTHWAFGSLRAPQEAADLLPDISLIPENSFTYDVYKAVENKDLQSIENDPETLQSLAKWFNSVDINYLDLKEPEYICHEDISKSTEFKPLGQLASRVIDTWEKQYPNLTSISFPPFPPTEIDSEVLFEEAIKSCNISQEQGNNLNDMVCDFLKKEFTSVGDIQTEQQFSDLQRPALEKPKLPKLPSIEKTTVAPREACLKQFTQFMDTVMNFADSMTEENITEDVDLLFFSNGLKVLSISTLTKIEKHVNRVIKNQCLEEVNKEILSALFQHLYNNIIRAECIVIVDLKKESNGDNSEGYLEEMKSACSISESGMLAAKLCLFMANNLNNLKTLFSENIIASSLNFLRNILSSSILPALEVLSEEFNISRYPNLKSTFEKDLNVITPRLAKLALSVSNYGNEFIIFVKNNDLSFDLVIRLLYIALTALFSDLTGGQKGAIFSSGASSNFKKRFQNVLQTVFVIYMEQREWIVEEVLTSLIKLPAEKRSQKSFRLLDGKKIHIATAIILQLVQSCAEKAISTNLIIDSQYNDLVANNFSVDSASFPFVTDLLLSGCQSGIEETSKVIGPVLKFMFARVSKGKGPNEAEYKFLLDTMVEDSLNVLNYPEWPAAELFLRGLCNILVTHIDDASTETYLKGYAIDYLGFIAARLKKYSIKSLSEKYQLLFPESDSQDLISSLSRMPEKICPDTPILLIKSMWACFEKLANYLLALSVDDSSNECARQLHFCGWGLYFGDAYTLAMTSDAEDDMDSIHWGVNIKSYLKLCLAKLISISYNAVNPDSLSVSDTLSASNREALYIINEVMAIHKPLYLNYDLILTRVLTLMESSTPMHRVKSVKALGIVLEEDNDSIVLPKVQNAITMRLQDTAASVRAVAVDLIGRCITLRPELSSQCYPAISERILDTSLLVRKCVIKIMRDLSFKISDKSVLVDICSRLLSRTLDVEVTARDLALRTLQDIWFSNMKHFPLTVEDNTSAQHESLKFELLSLVAQKEIMERAQIITHVVSSSGNNPTTDQLLSSFITKSLEKPDKSKADLGLKRWAYITAVSKVLIDCFFRHLINLESSEDKPAVCSTMKTLVAFGVAKDLSIPGIHLAALEPYFKASPEPIDQMMMYYVLKIYNMSLPDLENPNKVQLKIIEDLLISSLPKISTTVLAEAVQCVCLIASILNSRHGKIYKVYLSCINKLKADKSKVDQDLPIPVQKNTIRLVLIAGLLGQNIDKFASKESAPTLINTDEILNELYAIILTFIIKETEISVQAAALQGLGYVLIGYPKLFMKKDCIKMLLEIFQSDHQILKTKLLTTLSDFLTQEGSHNKFKDEEPQTSQEVNMQVLTGHSEEFQSASVSSHVIQNLLQPILNCLMGESHDLKTKALHVVGLILEQGHVNPALCAPALITLQSDQNKIIQKNATEISQKVASKFSTLFYSKNIEAVKLTFEYQKRTNSDEITGYRISDDFPFPQALLHNFYESIQSNRQRREDFFKSIIKLYDSDIESTKEKIDVCFLRFIAENLSFLDYKSPLEIIPLLNITSKVIVGAGANILHQLETNIGKELDNTKETQYIDSAFAIVCLIAFKLNLQLTYGLHNSKAFKEKLLVRVGTHDPLSYWRAIKIATDPSNRLTEAHEQLNDFLLKDSLSYTYEAISTIENTPPKDKTKKGALSRTKKKSKDIKKTEESEGDLSASDNAEDNEIDILS